MRADAGCSTFLCPRLPWHHRPQQSTCSWSHKPAQWPRARIRHGGGSAASLFFLKNQSCTFCIPSFRKVQFFWGCARRSLQMCSFCRQDTWRLCLSVRDGQTPWPAYTGMQRAGHTKVSAFLTLFPQSASIQGACHFRAGCFVVPALPACDTTQSDTGRQYCRAAGKKHTLQPDTSCRTCRTQPDVRGYACHT